LRRKLEAFFGRTAKHVTAQVARRLGKVSKAGPDEPPDERAEEILAAIDLGDWGEAQDALESLSEVYGDGYSRALDLLAEMRDEAPAAPGEARFGISLDQVNERAVAWAREQAAELVVDLEDNTREMLRATIVDAIEEGWGAVRLGKEIADSPGFSDERAETIGRTEVITANNRGNFDAYEASGVVERVEWLTAQDELVEEICEDNENAGPIDLGDAFPSGDDCPPAHPNCRCALIPVLEAA
jgi:SPP1 gp7 family putative phage head morphogenesis protein